MSGWDSGKNRIPCGSKPGLCGRKRITWGKEGEIKRNKILSVLVIIVLYLGCAILPPGEREYIENKREFNKSIDAVWKSIVEGLTGSGEKIALIKKDTGLIQVEKEISGQELKKSILNPGFTMWERGELKLKIFIVGVSDNITRVFCSVDIRGSGKLIEVKRDGRESVNLFYREKILTSNGRLEKMYLDLIESFITKNQVLFKINK